MNKNIWRSFELRLVAIILLVTVALSVSLYFLMYRQYSSLTISNLKEEARIVNQYVQSIIDEESFTLLNSIQDESSWIYNAAHQRLDEIRQVANVLYLYTAKQSSDGAYIYIVDGLPLDSEDFRHIGDPIEDEIIPELSRCLNNETFLDDEIKVTEWGIVYVTYFPFLNSDGEVIGAVGMEFDCETLYTSFRHVRMITIGVAAMLAVVFAGAAVLLLKRMIHTTESVLAQKDNLLIAAKEEALESSKAKSSFLSRMSHEIRTPMNAITGMTSIAQSTGDIDKIRHCISVIETSSNQLLNLINDILDMSKIEAGKFELDMAPMNIEKTLMQVCNLVVDRTEKKHQKFDIFIDKHMRTRYIGDELRISQIVTNLLSNAVKFTPEFGSVSLRVKAIPQSDGFSILRFSVSDTGIGLSPQQIDKLFTSFEQADGSISRKFGGTGLGLAISKNLVEKMGGRIWVESELDKGSIFNFEIRLEPMPDRDMSVIFDGISPSDVHVLIADGDDEVRQHFVEVLEHCKINVDRAESGDSVLRTVQKASRSQKPYDVIFLDYNLPGSNGLDTAKELLGLIDKNTIIIMTSFTEWNHIESSAKALGISRFIAKPLFRSSILDAINEVIGGTLKKLGIKMPAPEEGLDFSEVSLLLAEDIEINREIVIALLEGTGITIDTAENGVIAVEKFSQNPGKYNMILTDIQMPEMDGYHVAQAIRGLDTPEARAIPIIAMTANAFKEDVDACIAAGMDAHLAKPINMDDMYDIISRFKPVRQKS